jgi:cobalt-zinc-cadmium efflux system protein
MSADHSHAIIISKSAKYLWLALGLTSIFLIAEVVGGIISGSLALLSDAAHMLTDVSALAISLMAIHIAKRSADIKRTFGYYRFEILAAAFNAILLFLVAIYIIYEAYERLNRPADIQTFMMLIIASIGLVVNLVSMYLLSGGKDHSLNIKSAYLEVWSDMLGSIGVIVGALIIRYTGLMWVDSIIAVAIGIWVLPRTWLLLKETLNILLEGVPDGIDLTAIKKTMLSIDGVVDIHDLHIWAVTSGKVNLTSHVVIKNDRDCEHVMSLVRNQLSSQFCITHTTLQHEYSKCSDTENECYSAN